MRNREVVAGFGVEDSCCRTAVKPVRALAVSGSEGGR